MWNLWLVIHLFTTFYFDNVVHAELIILLPHDSIKEARESAFFTYLTSYWKILRLLHLNAEKKECVNSIIRDVALLQMEVALLREPNFPFLNAAKTVFHRNRKDSSSSSQSNSGSKKKIWRIRYGTYTKKTKAFQGFKDGNKHEFLLIIRCQKKPSKRPHIYVGRLGQQITTTEMEQYFAKNEVDLLHFRQNSKPESLLKLFNSVFNFDVESIDFWPENDTVSGFYLNNTAREWLYFVDQNGLKIASSLFSEKSQLNFFLNTALSVWNKTKDLSAIL